MTATTGARIMLIADGTSRGPICTTNGVSELIEDLQFTLGEGPCIDACRYGQPVLEPDLVSPTNNHWLAFSPPAIAADARAVFGFPIRGGAVRLGALNLYRDRPGPLTGEQYADALVLADVAAEFILLLLQAEAPPAIKQAERAKPKAHESLHQTQCDSRSGSGCRLSMVMNFRSVRPVPGLAESGECETQTGAPYNGAERPG